MIFTKYNMGTRLKLYSIWLTNGNLTNKQKYITIWFIYFWTGGATIVFFPSRFSTFPIIFQNMFLHTNCIQTIRNTIEKKSAKSVEAFSSYGVTKGNKDSFLYNTSCHGNALLPLGFYDFSASDVTSCGNSVFLSVNYNIL